MHHFYFSFLLLITSTTVVAQHKKPILGNGAIQKDIREITGNTNTIHFGMSVNAIVQIGEIPFLEITADENLLPHIKSEVNNHVLVIYQLEWIESDNPITVRITVPNLKAIQNTAWGEIRVQSLSEKDFSVDSKVGSISLEGVVENLILDTKLGKVDASNLQVSNGDVRITGWGEVRVAVQRKLKANLKRNSRLILMQKPEELVASAEESAMIGTLEDLEREKEKEVVYIQTKLVNNKVFKKAVLRVEGPRNAPFGYGFNVGPGMTRKENWPIGTRLYRQDKDGNESLVVEISDNSTKIQLF